ncbi:MAG: aspartate dehydrogenase [Parvularculaceae bacterium]|nr:aspartate dehydrogenase [Parvularculaceae bacterium]
MITQDQCQLASGRTRRTAPVDAIGPELSRPVKLCLVGWGAIAQHTVQLLLERHPETVAISAVALRDGRKPRPALPAHAQILNEPDDLLTIEADMVIEAAGRAAVAPWAQAALLKGVPFLVSSTSAFCDEDLLARLLRLAQNSGGRIIVPPGALGGIDALAAAGVKNLDNVHHMIIKPVAAWRGTIAEELLDLDALTAEATFFTGSARETADKFPKNANAAVISAMAGAGLDRTQVSLVADPAASRNAHRIFAAGDFGSMEMRIENAALPANPKSSEMTALNLVRAVERQISSLVL